MNDDIKNKLGERIEGILIAKKEEVEIMTSNISRTIKETFEQTREEARLEGREEGKIIKYSKLSENEILELKKSL